MACYTSPNSHTQTKTAKVIVDSRQQPNRSPTLEHGWNGPNCQHRDRCWAIPVLPLKRYKGTTRQDGLGLSCYLTNISATQYIDIYLFIVNTTAFQMRKSSIYSQILIHRGWVQMTTGTNKFITKPYNCFVCRD